MIRIREDVHIHASAEQLHRRLSALSDYAHWLPRTFQRVAARDGELSFELALPMRRERTRLAVTAQEQPRLLVLEGVDGAGSLTSLTWVLHAEAEGEVHLTLEFACGLPRGPFGPLLEPLLYGPLRRQSFRDALWRLKRMLEREPSNTSRVAAVIFDLDGVLADTEPMHLAATRALVAPAELETEAYERFIGRGGFTEWLTETYGIEAGEIEARYSQLFYAELERGSLRPLPGAVELIEAIDARGLALAVASQSSSAWVEATLRAVGLDDRLPLIVTAEEVGHDKPAPDIYLQAARLVGAAPEACIAIEDSVHGVAAAAAAGLLVVQSTQASFAAQRQPGAQALIGSLRDFDLSWLDGEALG